MLNPKGKLAHAVRMLWFVVVFVTPLLVLTEEEVVAKCGGNPSGGPGFWETGGCYYQFDPKCISGNWWPKIDRCVTERCFCYGAIDRFYSYCASPSMACKKINSGCWNMSCSS